MDNSLPDKSVGQVAKPEKRLGPLLIDVCAYPRYFAGQVFDLVPASTLDHLV